MPRYAEEEGDFYAVPRAAVVDALRQQPRFGQAVAETTIALIETLLDTGGAGYGLFAKGRVVFCVVSGTGLKEAITS